MGKKDSARSSKRFAEEDLAQPAEDFRLDDEAEEDEDLLNDPHRLHIVKLLGGLSLEAFESEYWGQKAWSARVSEEVLERLILSFHECDLRNIVQSCRKDDNSRFSADEVDRLANDLEDTRTVNLPFCYSPGALEIKDAFISSGLPGNDCEVGVYVSRPGCQPAPWHFDPNHNITIQLKGQKDWLYSAGDTCAMGSRALGEPVGNFIEQRKPLPANNPDEHTCFSLRAGSMLYIPPGHWHSVIPSGGDSFSIDLRIATIPSAKWICEALFAGLLTQQRDNGSPSMLKAEDWNGGALSNEKQTQADNIAQSISKFMTNYRMPRCFPFQPSYSDGMQLGGCLQFLHTRGFAVPTETLQDGSRRVCINPMVSVSVKKRDSATAILHLRSVSSLTSAEYIRYNLSTAAEVFDAVKALIKLGSSRVSDLQKICKQSRGDQKASVSKASASQKRAKLLLQKDVLSALLCTLLYGNVLYLEQ